MYSRPPSVHFNSVRYVAMWPNKPKIKEHCSVLICVACKYVFFHYFYVGVCGGFVGVSGGFVGVCGGFGCT